MFFDGESPTLKTFVNYVIIMANNSDKLRIVVLLFLLLIFELIQQPALVSFMLHSNILKTLKI